ncbi:MAG: MFS transporter [Gammaproteobacteria bacterium]|nr:MFS transporter [Gammaproteobacteria bacterium]
MKAALLRRPVLAWALYDWGNSAFATTVMAGFLPVFFKQYWSAGAPATVSTFRLGLAHAAGGALIALLAPFLGAMADRGGLRLKLLALFTLLGTATTAALYLVPQGDWVMAIVLYGCAGIGFAGGVTFCDALLMDVAGPAEYDLVSAWGYALGYVGGGVLFAVNVLMTLQPARFGLDSAEQAVRLSFVMVAAWWLLFTLPALLWVRERGPTRALPAAAALRAGLVELGATLRSIRSYRPLVWFLLAYWLYIDGVNTIIKMAVDFGLALGFPQQSLIVALLLTQFIAFPAALAFGWIGQRIGVRNGIFIAIGVYAAATVAAYFMDSVGDFYLLAVVVGLVQGGIQSLSRSCFAAQIPPGKQGEFFGFYNMMSKFAAVIGPLLVGSVALLTGSSRAGILSVLVLFAGGALLLWRARAVAHQAAGSSP